MRIALSLGAAITIGLGTATPALAANQALMINGIGGGAALPDVVMSGVLGGMFADYDRHNVDWPQQASPVIGLRYSLAQSINIGADNLDAAIRQALTRTGPGEHVTVVGLSAGSLVADEELRRLAANPRFDPSSLDFVVVGDSSRTALNKNRHDPFLNYTYTPPVDSPYNTTSVMAEYDGFADFPDLMNNLVAVANAIAGEMVSHVPSMFTDLSTVPSGSATVTTNSQGAVRTDYVISPAHLPLVQVMPLLGLFGESSLKSIIDSAYVRNDPPGAGSQTAAWVPTATAVPAASTADAAASRADAAEVAGEADAVDSGPAAADANPVGPGALPEAQEGSEPADGHASSSDESAPVGGRHRGARAGGNAGGGAKSTGGQTDSNSPRGVRGHRAS